MGGFYYLCGNKKGCVMNNQTIETLTMEEIRSRLSVHIAEPDMPITEDGFTMLYNGRNTFGLAVVAHCPYRLPGIRIGLLKKGEIKATLNLLERSAQSGTLGYFCDGTIFQFDQIPLESEVEGVVIDPWLMDELFPQGVPTMFNGQVKDALMPADEKDIAKVESLYESLMLVLRDRPYNRQAALAIITALCYVYNECYVRATEHPAENPSRQRVVFDRFIALVNEHAKSEHNLAFYADKLCLSQRYLSRVVWQTSGVYAKEWIDRAVITEAKVMLRHGQLTVAAISEALNFPNPSFFNKYFKRQTGQTPLAFRNG